MPRNLRLTERRRRVALCLAAGVAGSIVNCFPIVVLGDVYILFGGVFYLLVALVQGPGMSAIASAVAMSPILYWGNPYDWVAGCMEAVVVGCLARRRRSPLFADLLYWAIVGCPFIFWLSAEGQRDVTSLTWAITIKCLVNGVVNVLLAELLLHSVLVRRLIGVAADPIDRPSLKAYLVGGFLSIAILPVILLNLQHGRTFEHDRETDAAHRLEEAALTLKQDIDNYLNEHIQAIVSLASTLKRAGADTTTEISPWLADDHANYQGFITLVVANLDGTVIGIDPRKRADGSDPLSRPPSIADREYFRQPVRTAKPYVSDVILGRRSGEPIVGISAPLFGGNERLVGVVGGSLNLERFERFGRAFQLMPDAAVIIVDQRERVVYASQTPYHVLEKISDSPLIRAARQSSASSFKYVGRFGWVVGRATTAIGGWTVYIQVPLSTVRRDAYSYYLMLVAWIAIAISFSLLIARVIAVRILAALAQLTSFVKEVTHQSTAVRPVLPETAPAEINQLVQDVGYVAQRLGESNGRLEDSLTERDRLNAELQSVLFNLDGAVKERTQELQAVNDKLRHENSNRKQAEQALKVSEENYRLLFISNPHPMWVYDQESLKFLGVNQAAVELYGYSEDEFLLMTIQDLRPEEDIPRLMEYLKHEPEEMNFAGIWRHKKKDGSIIYVEIRSHPVMFRERSACLVLASDVSERRKLEAQLQQAQKMEGIGRLAGGIAHDFNNLLTVINGYAARLAKTSSLPTPQGADAERILKAGQRAAVLTHRLLAFSRKQHRQPRILNLNEVIQNIEEMLRRIIGEDIALETRLSQSRMIRADAGQVEQILMNLVTNARDAMPDGGRITIGTEVAELDEYYCRRHPGARPGVYSVLAVTDTGCGMDQKTQEHLFEPFFTTKPSDKGTGLGMAIVYGIVKQSDGFVHVYSEVDIGTTLRIYFPAVEGAAEAEPDLQARPVQERGSETILLVEDNEDLREYATEVLQSYGYKILNAGDGAEAVVVAQKYRGEIHLIITDVIMPGMGGRELAKLMLPLRPTAQVLYMSGYAEDAITKDGILEAGVELLQKPFSAESLISKVQKVLRSSSRYSVDLVD